MVKKITASFIRPTLEYAAVVWNPHLKKHIEKIVKSGVISIRVDWTISDGKIINE